MSARKNIIAFYRPLAGLTVEKQREACHEAAKQLGARIVQEYTAGELGDDAAEWRQSVKSTEVAMVAVLTAIPEPRRRGYRPSTALTEALTDFASRGVLVVAAMRDVSSADGKAWVAEVKAAHDGVSAGGRLPRKRAQRMARLSHENREPGASKRWKSPAMKPVLDRWASVWRDPVHPNARAALEAMPDDVKSDIGSVETAYRIFGRRAPGDKSAGGRPRKSKRKTQRRAPVHQEEPVGWATLESGERVRLTADEVRALVAQADANKARVEVLMPDELTAIRLLTDAFHRLKDFGWREAIYCPKDGTPMLVIEPGSSGQHPCHYVGEWPDGQWTDGDYGLRPCLFKLSPEDEAKRKAKMAEAAERFRLEADEG